jgi:hypothetical protein
MTPVNDEKCSATARITIPTTRIAQPSATALCGLTFVDATWATADTAKIEQTTRPATAWLSMPTTLAKKDGATAVNRPVTAKPANAESAAMANIGRTSTGTDTRCKPKPPLREDVSGAYATAAAASTASTM